MSIYLTRQNSSGIWTIYYLEKDGRNRVQEFLQWLEGKRLNDYKKVIANLRRISIKGPPTNREKFRKEQGKVFVIKEHQVRLYCFFGDARRSIVLTNGAVKKSSRANTADIKIAESLEKEWEDEKKGKKDQ